MAHQRKKAAEHANRFRLVLVCLAAWTVPGFGHLLMKRRKGIVLLIALLLMFVTGLALGGQLFQVDISQPMNTLWAVGDLGIGAPYFIARGIGYGAGRPADPTSEYGTVYLVVAGLLNMLVVLDAFDVAVGRK